MYYSFILFIVNNGNHNSQFSTLNSQLKNSQHLNTSTSQHLNCTYSAEKSATIFLYMLYALEREMYPVRCPDTFTTGM